MTPKSILLLIVFALSFITVNAQRSKVIAANQFIEKDKFKDAKEAIEDAIKDKKTESWARTWYTRGLLCQVAYQKGKKEKDKEKYELYPDQLYVAYNSYDKSLKLDKQGRIDDQIAPMYVQLANEFLNIGTRHYNEEDFINALKAFEHALAIENSPILTLKPDTSLLYNTALAAYKSENWDKAVKYLGELNNYSHSPNVLHLLYRANLEMGDTIAAKQALEEGVIRYEYDQTHVLLLADMHFSDGAINTALGLLDSAKLEKPDNPDFPYHKGLIYQKTEQYEAAIKSYERSVKLDSENIEAYANIAICYFNMAVEFDEKAQAISSNRLYQQEKARSLAARESARSWLEKAAKKDPLNEQIREHLNQLYQFLNKEKN